MSNELISRPLADLVRQHDELRASLGPVAVQTSEAVRAMSEAARPAANVLRTMQEVARPAAEALKALQDAGALTSLRRDMAHLEELVRSARYSFSVSRIEWADSLSASARALVEAQAVLAKNELRFQLPDMSAVRRLAEQFDTSRFAKEFVWATAYRDQIGQAVEAMRAPWLDMQHSLQSLGAFAEIQGIGIALRDLPAFSDQFADRLRLDLGDWRKPMDWPQAIFKDVPARRRFYLDTGFNARLTDFPAAAFDQSLAIAGLGDDLAADGEDNPESGFRRNDQAYKRLQRFETRLREFIEATMRAAFGENWVKHRVPGNIRAAWEEKREHDRASGQHEWPLFAYADFTDYETIIIRNDNWEDVFKAVFRRKELVRESLQRLYPIRICTMHARLITPDDMLYLAAETHRILRAIAPKR